MGPRASRRSRRHTRSLLRRLLRRGGLLLVGAVLALTALPVGWLALRPPVTTAFMLRSHWSDPATGRACPVVHYTWVGRDEIAPALRRAVVLAEDQRFLQHRGFDLRSIERAIDERDRGERLRGASTISQQVAKNLFLWPGRSWLRKGLEAWFTVWLELALSKPRILELYLNVAQFGPCVFGAEAAAQRYFGVPAADLDPTQAARLAAVLPSPGRIRAANPGPYAEERAKEILALLQETEGAAFLRGL